MDRVKDTDVASLAMQELAERQLARTRLLPFIMRSNPNYLPGWVHKDICLRLEKFVQDIIDKKSPRLMITVPPRHGKSEIVSRNLPAWFLGNYPNNEVISCSYSSSLANDFSRKVRNLMREEQYRQLFPDSHLDPETQSVSFWMTTKGGAYLPAGVSGPITGKGGHLMIIDDPVKNREEAESETTRESIWNWYTSTFYTRLAPGGGVLVIQCMTGDTPVLMADGVTKALIDVRVGDKIATFDEGRLASSTIRNHSSSGRDSVYKITTTSGRVVRANKRHPFLVENAAGELEWVRTKNLQSAQRIVTLKGSGVSGKGKSVKQMGAMNLPTAGGFADHTTTSGSGLLAISHLHMYQSPEAESAPSLSTATESALTSTSESLNRRMEPVPSANPLLTEQITLNTGLPLSALTTATTQDKFEDCSATNVTLSSKHETPPKYLNALPSTSDFTTEEIASVTYDGEEEVFDVQVDRTENFIANGIVSHNTRWHHDDLAGKLLTEMEQDGDQWEVVDYPAIAINDEQYRKKGEALHPERYDETALARIKRAVGPRDWQALYQQQPTPDDGEYFTKQMIRYYRTPDLPLRETLEFYTAWDMAVGIKETNDWSVGITIGLDPEDNIWIVDLFRKRVDAAELVEEILDTWELWRSDITGIEEGVIKHAIGPFLDQRVQERFCYDFYAEPLKVGKKDKAARARSIQGRMKQGKVFFPEDAGFTPDLLKELLQFPNGKHDDQVDALAHLGQLLGEMRVKQLEKPKKQQEEWRKRIASITREVSQGAMGA